MTTSDIAPADIAAVTVGGNTYTSLTLSTEITNPHGTVTSYGFCWSAANALPTTGDSSVELAGKAFSHTIDGLLPNTLVHIRAYAVNDAGLNYGDVLSVRTRTYDCGGNMAAVVPARDVPHRLARRQDAVQRAAGLHPDLHRGQRRCLRQHQPERIGRPQDPAVPSQVVNLAPYRIAKYEVTNADYVEFLNLYKSATVKEGDYAGKELLFMQGTKITYDAGSQSWSIADDLARHPVVGVTWYGAYEFCRFFGGFLPSEAQWENAARGNVYSNDPSVPMYRYSGSNDLAEVAVYNSVETAEVGTRSRTSWESTICRATRRSGPTPGTTTTRRRSPSSVRAASLRRPAAADAASVVSCPISSTTPARRSISTSMRTVRIPTSGSVSVTPMSSKMKTLSVTFLLVLLCTASLSARPKAVPQGFADSLLRCTVERVVPAAKYVWNWRDAVVLKALTDLYDLRPELRPTVEEYVLTAMHATAERVHGNHPNGVASGVGLAFLVRAGLDDGHLRGRRRQGLPPVLPHRTLAGRHLAPSGPHRTVGRHGLHADCLPARNVPRHRG